MSSKDGGEAGIRRAREPEDQAVAGATGRRITPVILSGGAGTRLWPLSREERPKQLLALTGRQTMLQMTAARVRDAELFEAPIVVCGQRHAADVEAQLDALGAASARLIIEPCARNTAAAIALAALAVDAEALLLIMPSDHLIRDPAAFIAAVRTGAQAAEENWLVTFGIAADRPETGYGYIRRGELLTPGVFRADRFVEKPDLATAAGYLAEGGYDWNGGIFLVRSGAVLSALERHDPAVLEAARAAMAAAGGERARIMPDKACFAAAPSRSIDNAVMEHAERVAVVPVEMHWSDVGSWDAVHELGEADAGDNVLGGDVLAIGTEGCLIRTDGPLIAAIGVKDLIVVATADAVLIVPRGQGQRVKEIAEALKEKRGD